MTTKKRAEKCTTHFAGCDCREYRHEQMESALKVIRTWAAFDLENCGEFGFPVALDREAVLKLCDKAIGKTEWDDDEEWRKRAKGLK